MSILDRIIANKIKEVELRMKVFPQTFWEQSPWFEREALSLSQGLKNSPTGIIAEHKRRSPSLDNINTDLSIHKVAQDYQKAGVTGISVLTDQKYFGGSLEDLTAARAECQIPILRKEFIIDPYQLFEAKAHGADTILLIAAVLDRERIKQLSETAQSIGLEVLLEVHNQEELNKALMPSLNMIGVNNRNLKTFEVSIENSMALAECIPNDFVKVSESGISSTAAIKALKPHGYEGFLIGENFMKSESPGLAASSFIKTLIQ